MTRALQAIVFDFDGVIANSEPLHLRAFQQTLLEVGIELTASEYYARYLGYDDENMFRALAQDRGLPMDADRLQGLMARKGDWLQQGLRGSGEVLFPGVREFISSAAAEVPIAIASGALRHEIVDIIDAAGMTSLFSVIVAAGDTPEGKPSPAPYQLAVSKLREMTGHSLQTARCVAIEDSAWGLESALGAGLRCVGVTSSYPASLLQGAELVVAGLHELTLPDLDRLCASR